MRLNTDLRYLIKKYQEQIATWRAGPLVPPWREIAAEIARLENLPPANWPSREGLRQAWVRLAAKAEKPAKQEYRLETGAAIGSTVKHKSKTPSVLPDEAAKPEKPAKQANQPETRMDKENSQPENTEPLHMQAKRHAEAAGKEENNRKFASMFSYGKPAES